MLEGIVRILAAQDSKDTFGVYLAEGADGAGSSVELQRAHEFDEQDRRLGQDTYCIVLDGGAQYGGVVSWGLRGRTFVLRLDDRVCKAFGIDGGLMLDLQVDASSLRALEDGVPRVLVGVARDDDIVPRSPA